VRIRVVNDLERTRLSRLRMFWLLPHPLYPLPSVSSKSRKTMKERQLADGGVGGRGRGGVKSYDSGKASSCIIIQYSLVRRSLIRLWLDLFIHQPGKTQEPMAEIDQGFSYFM
jgi:hypothetical protein